MIYQGLAKGYSFGCAVDPFTDESFEILVSGLITQGELSRALCGLPFFAFDEQNRRRDLPACSPEVFFDYYEVFENCENFGLPHGRGWAFEADWLLDFLREMRRAKAFLYGDKENRKENERTH
ncbi:MAG: hypothetical protein AAF975_08250 [Spirochaetota bacterium]